jgi:hypothetical protein
MPLRLARYGMPLAETAPAGLASAGIAVPRELLSSPVAADDQERSVATVAPVGAEEGAPSQWFVTPEKEYGGGYDPTDEQAALEPDSQPHNQELGRSTDTERGPTPVEPAESDEDWAAFYRSAAGQFEADRGHEPDARELSQYLMDQYEVADQFGRPLAPEYLAPYAPLPQGEDPAPFPVAALPANDEHVEAPRKGQPMVAAEEPPRAVVQVLLPESDGADPVEEPEAEQVPEPVPGAELSGIDRVEFHYRELPPEMQARSAKALAPDLAEVCGYAEGTVRKYIGELRRRGVDQPEG